MLFRVHFPTNIKRISVWQLFLFVFFLYYWQQQQKTDKTLPIVVFVSEKWKIKKEHIAQCGFWSTTGNSPGRDNSEVNCVEIDEYLLWYSVMAVPVRCLRGYLVRFVGQLMDKPGRQDSEVNCVEIDEYLLWYSVMVVPVSCLRGYPNEGLWVNLRISQEEKIERWIVLKKHPDRPEC